MSNLIRVLMQALPAPDPLPLPAFPWIFLFLLYLTFTLHMLAMNLTVGGAALLVTASFSRSERMGRFRSFLSRFLPISLAFTITLGVAPLLFIQVLYGRLFFTTSIIMGWWWLALLFLLVFAYYGLYLVQLRPDNSGFVGRAVPIISLAALFLTALILTMNFKLFYRFGEWFDFGKSGSGGWFLNLGQPQVIPSWLAHLTVSLALGGFLLVLHGWARKSKNPEYAAWACRFGGVWFAVFVLLHLIATVWLLWNVSEELGGMNLLSGAYLGSLIIAGFSAYFLAGLAMLWTAVRKSYGRPVVLTAFLIPAGTTAMTLRRAEFRTRILSGLEGFDIGKMEVAPQWDTISIFAVLLVVGLAVVAWMAWATIKGKREDPEAPLSE
jgi:hypothetical protein